MTFTHSQSGRVWRWLSRGCFSGWFGESPCCENSDMHLFWLTANYSLLSPKKSSDHPQGSCHVCFFCQCRGWYCWYHDHPHKSLSCSSPETLPHLLQRILGIHTDCMHSLLCCCHRPLNSHTRVSPAPLGHLLTATNTFQVLQVTYGNLLTKLETKEVTPTLSLR